MKLSEYYLFLLPLLQIQTA